MKNTVIAIGVAALVAAAVAGAQDAGGANAGRDPKLGKWARRGAAVDGAQRQKLKERILARRGADRARKGGDGAGAGLAIRDRFIQLYDTDGDGTLSDEERAAVREDLKARHTRLLQKYDQDGDGVLGESERARVRADLLEFFKDAAATYDSDGDGVLSPEERKTAFEELWKAGAFLKR